VNWDQFGESIRRWRDYRKKHHHRNDSSSTLPWVDSLDDIAFGVKGQDVNNGGTTSEKSGDESLEKDQGQTNSRGELTMEWMDDNYMTPGGYYGNSMGPATQFWRHGRGAWSGGGLKSMCSSGEEGGHRSAGHPATHRNGKRKVEVVRRHGSPLEKFLSGDDSDSSSELNEGDGDDESEYGNIEAQRRFDDGISKDIGQGEVEETEESESDDDDNQQITFKSKGKTPLHH
jgi:[calcium/calmodulin-dependent protein kinase] kinase